MLKFTSRNIRANTIASSTGAIANATTSIGINHGLPVTPTWVTITPTLDPTNTPGAIFVTNLAASSFTVNCENDPGATGLGFIWRAGA